MTSNARTGAIIGSCAALAVAGLLVPARDWIGSINVSLLLVVVVVITAALADRTAAAVTALAAALAYYFFHTRPYYTLRVTDRVDVATIGLLVVVGLVCAQVSSVARRSATRASERAADLQGWATLVDLAAHGARDELVAAATAFVHTELGLTECCFEPAGAESSGPVAALERNGSFDAPVRSWTPVGFELPATGVQIAVARGNRHLGRLVLVPTPGVGIPLERRRLAVTVADLLAATTSPQPETAARTAGTTSRT